MEAYPFTSVSLAHYVVNKCTLDDYPVSNLQLQKILYFLQSVYCMLKGKLLFAEEFEAWPYGPVLPAIYREYSSFGGRFILMKYGDTEINDSSLKAFIDGGIEVLRSKYPWDLVKTSHAPNSPWAQIYRDGAGYKATIPNELLLEASRMEES